MSLKASFFEDNSIISLLMSELFGHTEAFEDKKPPGWADFVHELS
jgi:hypothetical protein